jgi:hypothetical protein
MFDSISRKVVLGVAPVGLLALIGLVAVIFAPFKIDEDTAAERLLTSEVQMPLASVSDPYNSLVDKTFIFGSDGPCSADNNADDLLETSGKILAFKAFNDVSVAYNQNYLEEVLVEFKNSEQASAFVGLARTGFSDGGCKKDDDLFGVLGPVLYGQTGGNSLAQTVDGAENDSFSFSQEMQFFSRFPNNDRHWQRNVSLAAKGHYVVMVVATVDLENPSELSEDTLKSYATIAIKKAFK